MTYEWIPIKQNMPGNFHVDRIMLLLESGEIIRYRELGGHRSPVEYYYILPDFPKLFS